MKKEHLMFYLSGPAYLSILFSGPIHFPEKFKIIIFFTTEYILLCIYILIIHHSVDRYPEWFYTLAVVNRKAIYTNVQMSLELRYRVLCRYVQEYLGYMIVAILIYSPNHIG